MRVVSATELARGPSVEEALRASALAGARLLAGAGGIHRVVEHLSVMEQPDILPWVKPHELLLTTGYPLRHANGGLPRLVDDLDARGLAGVAIKLGPYMSSVPEAMLARADELGFPIIQLPDNAAFDEILNEVLSEILARQAATLALSEQVHRALTQVVLRDGGLQEIADVVAELLGGAVVIADPTGTVLASVDADDVVKLLSPEGLVSADGCVTADHLDPGVIEVGGGRCLVVPISAGESRHGCILFAERDRALGVTDVHALENAATVAALAITKVLAVAAVESKYRADLLYELIDGPRAEPTELLARAAALDWDLDRPIVVMVIGPRHPDAASGRQLVERQLSAARAVVRAHDPNAGIADFRDGIVVLLGASDPASLSSAERTVGRTLKDALGAGAGPAVSIGISRPVNDVHGVQEAYAQAHRAWAVGRQFPSGVAHFDDLGVYRLLTLIADPGELTTFAADVLGPLAGDSKESGSLRATLDALFSTNLNVAEAARLLHFHYNTVRYRLDKLEHILGPFRVDANLRLSLQVALRIVELEALEAGGE